MHTRRLMSVAMAAGLLGSTALAGRVAGPHRGRIVEAAGARIEFVLDKARKAHVYVLDDAGAPAAPGKVIVSLRANLKAGAKAVPVTATTAGIDGSKEAIRHFVSKSPLPAPDGYELVLTVKSGGKTANARIQFVEHTCGGCRLAEYACICDH